VINVQWQRIHREAKKPTKGKPGDEVSEFEACYDFYVVADDEFRVYGRGMPRLLRTPEGVRASFILEPGATHLFHLGLKTAIEPGFGCFFWDRSGMGGKQLIHRFAGAIDSTYRGEWMVRLFNFDSRSHIIHEGDRIVQGAFRKTYNATWEEVDELPESTRGEGGFGHTGR
jgi:dUTP pyrophosphatase